MPESLAGPLTAFDAIAIVIIIISALMAVARGFMRELATLGAFVAAIAAAYYGRLLLRDQLAGALPENLPTWTPDAILVAAIFIITYVVVAWLGQRVSRSVHGPDGLGPMDRIAGLIFGVVRGVIAMIFFVLLVQLALPAEKIPPWIQDGRLYGPLATAADYVHSNAPRIAENAETVLPNEPIPDN